MGLNQLLLVLLVALPIEVLPQEVSKICGRDLTRVVTYVCSVRWKESSLLENPEFPGSLHFAEFPPPRGSVHLTRCDADMDDYCTNGGVCYVVRDVPERPHLCWCEVGFIGKRCEIGLPTRDQNIEAGFSPRNGSDNLTKCEADMDDYCANGGVCYVAKDVPDKPHLCWCEVGFTGERCELNQTTGEENKEAGFSPPRGSDHLTRCDADMDDYCVNDGICYVVKDAPDKPHLCWCKAGFIGKRCELILPTRDENTIAGFSPRDGSIHLRRCDADMDNYCENGGSCYVVKDTPERLYLCWCIVGFTGKRCEISQSTGDENKEVGFPPPRGSDHLTRCDADLDDYCTNGGVCYVVKDIPERPHLCWCKAEYTGKRCEISLPTSDQNIEGIDQDGHQPNAELSSGHLFDLNKSHKNYMDTAEGETWQKSKYPVGMADHVRSGFPQFKRFKRQDMTMAERCCILGCTTEEIIATFC